MKTPITIILLGDIAAGKGTQAKVLINEFKLHLTDTGVFSRRMKFYSSAAGHLAPTAAIKKYLTSSLEKLNPKQDVLIDGGKMPNEARLIYKILSAKERKILVVYLHIAKGEILKRLAMRYYCKNTDKPLIIKNKAKKCPHCGGQIYKREDDKPIALRNRIDYYNKIYSKTVRFWRKLGLLRFVNGKQRIAKVTKDITQTIKNYYSL